MCGDDIMGVIFVDNDGNEVGIQLGIEDVMNITGENGGEETDDIQT